MITLAKIEEAAAVLADQSLQYVIRLRFGRNLYYKAVFVHQHPREGMILTSGNNRFQVWKVLNDLNKCLIYCHKITRKRFNPEAEGFTKVDSR